MARDFGICALCKETKILQISHLLPAGLDRLIRASGERNPHPIILTRERTIKTSRQICSRLLCWDCEQRFNKRGENWVLRNCYRSGKGFKLREILWQSEPVFPDDEYAFYSAKQNQAINISALVYFASSVFWRAAVCVWKFADATVHMELGPYEEQLRQYLCEISDFPPNAAMLVGISTSPKPLNAVNYPRGRRMGKFRHYDFHIPGVIFDLYVGAGIPHWVRQLCAYRSPDNMVYASNRVDKRTHQILLKSFRGAAQYL